MLERQRIVGPGELPDAIRFEQQWMGTFPFHDSGRVPSSRVTSGQGFPRPTLPAGSVSFMPATVPGASRNEGATRRQTLNAILSLIMKSPTSGGATSLVGIATGISGSTEGLATYIALVGGRFRETQRASSCSRIRLTDIAKI